MADPVTGGMEPGQPGGAPGALPPGAGAPPGAAPAAGQQMSAGIKAKADQMVQAASTMLSMAMPMYGPGTEEGKTVMMVLKHLSEKFSLGSGPEALSKMVGHLAQMKAQGGAGGPPPGAGAPPPGA